MAALLSELRRLRAAAADPNADADERRSAERQRLRVEREIRTLADWLRLDRVRYA